MNCPTETNPALALQKFISGEIVADLTFLDIEMPELSGIELGEILKAYTTVIFVTAHPDFAYQSYDMDIVDFIVKPVSLKRLIKSVNKAKAAIESRKGRALEEDDALYLNVKMKDGPVQILRESIYYLESASNYTFIYTKTTKIMVYATLSSLNEMLSTDHFMRIHRSFIINLAKVSGMKNRLVNLEGIFFVPSLGTKGTGPFEKGPYFKKVLSLRPFIGCQSFSEVSILGIMTTR
eukprot:gene17058-20321_t